MADEALIKYMYTEVDYLNKPWYRDWVYRDYLEAVTKYLIWKRVESK
jgi:hypothetical protein